MYNDLELDSIYENVYEYYINDYIIFEGILRRDYMECIGILTEDGNKNFLQKLWEKIIELFDSIKMKIIKIITDFVSNIEIFKESLSITSTTLKMAKYLDKLTINELKDFLSDFKIDNYKSFRPEMVDKAIEKSEYLINEVSFEDQLSVMKNKLEKIPSKETILKIIKELSWNKEYEENPFKDNIQSNINFIMNFLFKKHESVHNVIDLKNSIIKKIENKKNEAKKMQRKYKYLSNNIKYKEKNIDNNTTTELIKYTAQKEDANVVSEIEDVELYTKKINIYIKLLSSVKACFLFYMSSICKELNIMHKEALRLYTSAGKHITKKIVEDIRNNPEKKKYYKDLFKDYRDKVKQEFKNQSKSQKESYISDEYDNALSEAIIYEYGF